MTTVVQKKSKARARHKDAVEGWQKWCRDNPRASKKKRNEMFDLFVDSAKLIEEVNGTS